PLSCSARRRIAAALATLPSPFCFFFVVLPPPPTSTLFPYTTLFRSALTLRGLRRHLQEDEPGLAIAPGFDLLETVGDRELRRFRSEEHTSELQSRENLVCRLLLEKKKITETIGRTAADTIGSSVLDA